MKRMETGVCRWLVAFVVMGLSLLSVSHTQSPRPGEMLIPWRPWYAGNAPLLCCCRKVCLASHVRCVSVSVSFEKQVLMSNYSKHLTHLVWCLTDMSTCGRLETHQPSTKDNKCLQWRFKSLQNLHILRNVLTFCFPPETMFNLHMWLLKTKLLFVGILWCDNALKGS